MTRPPNDPTDNPEFKARLRDFGVEQVQAGSVLAASSSALVRGWCVALDRAHRPAEKLPEATRAWLQERLQSIASKPANDEQRALAGEVEAGLRLAWLGPVERVQETSKATTTDFRLGDLNIEVYCPQEHRQERQVVAADIAQQLERATGPVRVGVAISHPTTGSGRSLDPSGRIQRDLKSLALAYPANKLIDRLLSAKRDAKQFRDSEQNILWLDLKHGLGLRAQDCVPFRSELAKGQCFLGTHGIWHAFYGDANSPHFPERTTLEWPVGYEMYAQQVRGWFRETPKVTAAILAVLDGVILFENPWTNAPLSDKGREELHRLSELRPELSWTASASMLEQDVTSALAKIAWLARIAGTRWKAPDGPLQEEPAPTEDMEGSPDSSESSHADEVPTAELTRP